MLERFRSAEDNQAKLSAEERVRRKLAAQKKNASKLLTIFRSCEPNPLKEWGVLCFGGITQMIKDADHSGKPVLEMRGQVMKTSIWSPLTRKEKLDISLPVVYILLKHVCS